MDRNGCAWLTLSLLRPSPLVLPFTIHNLVMRILDALDVAAPPKRKSIVEKLIVCLSLFASLPISFTYTVPIALSHFLHLVRPSLFHLEPDERRSLSMSFLSSRFPVQLAASQPGLMTLLQMKKSKVLENQGRTGTRGAPHMIYFVVFFLIMISLPLSFYVLSSIFRCAILVVLWFPKTIFSALGWRKNSVIISKFKSVSTSLIQGLLFHS